jgi:hypothetical protein
MWSFVVVAIVFGLTGVYTVANEQAITRVESRKAMTQAENMAVYREAVIQYFTDNDDKKVEAPFASVKSYLPAWSLMKDETDPIWANWRDNKGVIYVYPKRPLGVDILKELLALSQNSHLVGAYAEKDKGNKASLLSPLVDVVEFTLDELKHAKNPVPPNAPVWIGYRK